MNSGLTLFKMVKSQGRRTPPRPRTPKKRWDRIYLFEWRTRRGMTTEGLAAKAGVSPGLISQIENKRSNGSPDSFKKLAKALGIEPEELFQPPPAADMVVLNFTVPERLKTQIERIVRAALQED